VLFLKPDVFIILDSVRLAAGAAAVQARYQVFNDDKNGKVKAGAADFTIDRPGVSLHGRVFSQHAVTVKTGTLALPDTLGVFPYAETESAPALEHELVTICTAQSGAAAHGTLSARCEGAVWKISGSHNAIAVNITIDTAGDIPAFTIA